MSELARARADEHRPGAVTTATVLRSETGEGLRAILREPTALFFSVLMPVAFYALFTGVFGGGTSPDGVPYAAASLATYGAFGVVSVMLLNPGIGVADDRSRGWLRVKKVSATPIGVVLAARVLAALPYAVGVLLAMSAVAALIAGPVLSFGAWLGLVGALLLGGLPFALFGLAVGFLTSTNTAAAVLNAVLFPMVIASGLWVPVQLLPGFLQAVAPLLPTYHLARLATAALTGGPVVVPVLVLLVTTAAGAAAAAYAYRRMRV